MIFYFVANPFFQKKIKAIFQGGKENQSKMIGIIGMKKNQHLGQHLRTRDHLIIKDQQQQIKS